MHSGGLPCGSLSTASPGPCANDTRLLTRIKRSNGLLRQQTYLGPASLRIQLKHAGLCTNDCCGAPPHPGQLKRSNNRLCTDKLPLGFSRMAAA
jgi:hypothetical protein